MNKKQIVDLILLALSAALLVVKTAIDKSIALEINEVTDKKMEEL